MPEPSSTTDPTLQLPEPELDRNPKPTRDHHGPHYGDRFPTQSAVDEAVVDAVWKLAYARDADMKRIDGLIQDWKLQRDQVVKSAESPIADMSASEWLNGPARGSLRLDENTLNRVRSQQPSARELSFKFNGIWGTVDWTFEIIQVVDGQTFIGKRGREIDSPWLWCRGWNTSEFADGERIRITQSIAMTGTQSYVTVLGARKTLKSVETFDWQRQLSKPAFRLIDEVIPSLPPIESPITDASIDTAVEELKRLEERLSTKKHEKIAAGKLRLAKKLFDKRTQQKRLKMIVDNFPDTAAAKEAAELLNAPATCRRRSFDSNTN